MYDAFDLQGMIAETLKRRLTNSVVDRELDSSTCDIVVTSPDGTKLLIQITEVEH